MGKAYEMNPTQRYALNSFLDFAKHTDQYEVKELEITDCCGDAYVSAVIGLKNDNGTLAEFICRDMYLFFIGRRGGIYQFNHNIKNLRKVYRKYYEVEHL